MFSSSLFLSVFLFFVVLLLVFFFFFVFVFFLFFFFFSSRRRHTRYIGDWSSDVCSSDLAAHGCAEVRPRPGRQVHLLRGVVDPAGDSGGPGAPGAHRARAAQPHGGPRSEERRVGKECRSRWWSYHEKKKVDEG